MSYLPKIITGLVTPNKPICSLPLISAGSGNPLQVDLIAILNNPGEYTIINRRDLNRIDTYVSLFEFLSISTDLLITFYF